MTEGQRDYLADLALKKGERVDASIPRSPAWASAEIERLKLLPDAEFSEISDNENKKIANEIIKIEKSIDSWGFAK